MINRIVLISLTFYLSFSFAQQGITTDSLRINNRTFSDTAASRMFDYFAYPYAYYTPETQFAFGAGGMLYFRTTDKEHIRPSKVVFSAYYTSNNQYGLNLTPAVYFPGPGRDLLEMKLQYTKEQSKFYGIGPDTPEIENPDYIMTYFRLYGEFGGIRLLLDDLHTGFIYDYSSNTMADKIQNPFFTGDSIQGENGGQLSGMGMLLILDKRDNVFFPSQGIFYKFRGMVFGRDIGSDYAYWRLVGDMRHYVSLPYDNILAFQFYADMTDGNVPFFKLPALGGASRMRGYFLGRFRDKQYMTAQVEYRKIVWWRLGVAAFYGIGDVADKLVNFKLLDFKPSYGFGIRFVFDEAELINLRVDFGFGENTNGIYFSMEEAF